jgi:Spy/CpxP family protein refolding chaperone
MKPLSFCLAAILAIVPVVCFAASPYAGEQSRSIKSLSKEDVADYIDGKGMGFAKAAELNGYPGPAHVLELAEKLALTPAQRIRTEEIFGRMQTRARELGTRLVEEERRLDELFASKAVSRQSLATLVSAIAAIRSDLRATHLQAHLEQTEILSAAQTAKYSQLRGYADAGPHLQHRH